MITTAVVPSGNALPEGGALDVTNLAKVFWPTQQFTKGDLLRYYARVSPLILPAVGPAVAWVFTHRAFLDRLRG